MSNDAWAKALEEVESPELRDKGLWARSFAEAGGDEAKARAAYINAKVEQKPAFIVPDLVFVCPACGRDCPQLVDSCPHCKAIFSEDGWKPSPKGANQPLPTSPAAATAAESSSWGWVKWVIGIPVGGFILLMIIGTCTNSPESDLRFSQENAIKLCWKEQGRKSLDPGTARFVAGACEKMESDFQQRWGRAP